MMHPPFVLLNAEAKRDARGKGGSMVSLIDVDPAAGQVGQTKAHLKIPGAGQVCFVSVYE